MDVHVTSINVPIFTPTVDAKQASYMLWFSCKHLTRKVKRVLRVGRTGNVRLPQEIVDYIVDYVSDDRPTLFACTHLSRTWCIAARAHLHRTFTVLDFAGFEAVGDLQSMGIVHLVRRIAVARRIHQADFLLPGTMAHLNAFTHLQELDIRYLNVGELLDWLHKHSAILKSTVRTLTLRYPRGTTKQLLCFISLFSSLENLTVESIESEFIPGAIVPALESSPPLTGRLSLTGIFDQEFMSGLASLQKGLKFRTVDLQFCGEVQEVIDSCAETMEQFICHPSDFRGKSDSPHISRRPVLMVLDRHQGLESIRMRFSLPRRSQFQFHHQCFSRPSTPQLHLHHSIISAQDMPYHELRQRPREVETDPPGVSQPRRKIYVTEGEREEGRENHARLGHRAGGGG